LKEKEGEKFLIPLSPSAPEIPSVFKSEEIKSHNQLNGLPTFLVLSKYLEPRFFVPILMRNLQLALGS
jgi:hypothetical protein